MFQVAAVNKCEFKHDFVLGFCFLATWIPTFENPWLRIAFSALLIISTTPSRFVAMVDLEIGRCPWRSGVDSCIYCECSHSVYLCSKYYAM